jgi:hypothetical protein
MEEKKIVEISHSLIIMKPISFSSYDYLSSDSFPISLSVHVVFGVWDIGELPMM